MPFDERYLVQLWHQYFRYHDGTKWVTTLTQADVLRFLQTPPTFPRLDTPLKQAVFSFTLASGYIFANQLEPHVAEALERSGKISSVDPVATLLYDFGARVVRPLAEKVLTPNEYAAVHSYVQDMTALANEPSRDGSSWKDLATALNKLPTLGDLGIRIMTVRGVSKEYAQKFDSKITGLIWNSSDGALYLQIGNQVHKHGLGHFTSTSLFRNASFWALLSDKDVGFLVVDDTGVPIGWSSSYLFFDGSEVLYRPGSVTHLQRLGRSSQQHTVLYLCERERIDPGQRYLVNDTTLVSQSF